MRPQEDIIDDILAYMHEQTKMQKGLTLSPEMELNVRRELRKDPEMIRSAEQELEILALVDRYKGDMAMQNTYMNQLPEYENSTLAKLEGFIPQLMGYSIIEKQEQLAEQTNSLLSEVDKMNNRSASSENLGKLKEELLKLQAKPSPSSKDSMKIIANALDAVGHFREESQTSSQWSTDDFQTLHSKAKEIFDINAEIYFCTHQPYSQQKLPETAGDIRMNAGENSLSTIPESLQPLAIPALTKIADRYGEFYAQPFQENINGLYRKDSLATAALGAHTARVTQNNVSHELAQKRTGTAEVDSTHLLKTQKNLSDLTKGRFTAIASTTGTGFSRN